MGTINFVGALVALAALLAAGGLAGVTGTNVNLATPPTPGVQAPQPNAATNACSADAWAGHSDLKPFLTPEQDTCASCPAGSVQCFHNRECDAICGGKGLGKCVKINSCFRCCSCSLT